MWHTHVALALALLGRARREHGWLALAIGSVMPDVPFVITCCAHCLWTRGRVVPDDAYWDGLEGTWLAALAYHAFHSLPAVLLAPRAWRAAYMLHLLADVPSHTGYWSVRPLLIGSAVPGFFDAWRWWVI